ncbi:hypothetical protein [Soonwooa sp.]|uniref:hypothetical protein n=1 Tax=Soonwooa sp. TaxID=1938592 RepID=UPI0028A80D3D|nr:hypothetical protein [Soonwooa sp.]
MKYFEASINDLENTVEERFESVREVGRLATEKFPEQYISIQDGFKNMISPNYSLFAFTIS